MHAPELCLAITGVGMLTPVGLSAYASLHAVRCGLSRFSPQPLRDRAKGWITGARVMAWLPAPGERRMAALADAAIAQALQQARWNQRPTAGRLTVLLCGAEDQRPGPRLGDDRTALTATLSGGPAAACTQLETLQAGAAGVAPGLRRARQLLEADAADACLVGAADSQLDLRITRWLEDAGRLKCSYANDGRIPAEAAAFVLVEPLGAALARGAAPLALLAGAGLATEPLDAHGQPQRSASARTASVREALAASPLAPTDIGMVWSDLNGESARGLEWGLASVRLGLADSETLLHPADCWGDLGAATGCALLAVGAMAQASGWAARRPLLLTVGSDGAARAGCVLLPPTHAALLQVSRQVPRIYRADYRIERPPGPVSNVADPLRQRFQDQLIAELATAMASLCDQRTARLRDGASWQACARLEQRMLDHLDALVAAGAQAMAHVAEQCKDGDAGMVCAAALLAGTLPHPDNLQRLNAALGETPDLAMLQGLRGGLAHAPRSVSLSTLLQTWTADARASVRVLALQLIGLRRETQLPISQALLADPNTEVRVGALELLGRRRALDMGQLMHLIAHGPAALRRHAWLAALRLDAAMAARLLRARMDASPDRAAALALPLALAGARADGTRLLAVATRLPCADTVLALGVHGDPAAVPALIGWLGQSEPLAGAAARALRLLSGVVLDEQVEIEREVDLLGGETARVREIQRRPSQSPALWTRWWRETLPALPAAHAPRLRQGQAFSVATVLSELEHADVRMADRARAALELDIHGPVPVPLDVEWFVARQQRVLSKLRAQVAAA